MSVQSSASKRWLKRWSRRAVAAADHATRRVLGGSPPIGLRILTYHRIENDTQDPFAVSPEAFRSQMAMLRSAGQVVPLGEALDRLTHEERESSSVALTFDDGTRDFLENALPVLEQLHLPATLYVSPERVGSPGFLDWSELKRMVGPIVAVQSHGLDHRSLGRMDSVELWRQVDQSKKILEDRLACPVTSIAYPYGTIMDFDARVKESVRRAGYQCGCSSVNGINHPGADRYELRRTKIEQGDLPSFPLILAGGLDRWALIDRYLAGLQNRYL